MDQSGSGVVVFDDKLDLSGSGIGKMVLMAGSLRIWVSLFLRTYDWIMGVG